MSLFDSVIQTYILDRSVKARTERVLTGREPFPYICNQTWKIVNVKDQVWKIANVKMTDDPDFVYHLEVHDNLPCPWAKIVLTYKGTEVFHWSTTNSLFGCYGTTLHVNPNWQLTRDLRIRLDVV